MSVLATPVQAWTSSGTPGGTVGTRERRWLTLVWGALFVNVLTVTGTSVLPLTLPAAQLVTQGALFVAAFGVLVVNVRGTIRPNLFLVLLSVLAVGSLMVSLHSEFWAGSVFRAFRLLGFVVVLWLLTPWFGRRDLLLLRCHQRILWGLIGTVVLGALVAPGTAFAFEGRLAGVLWPIWPTQVAHHAAVLLGTSVLLWMCRLTSGRSAAAALLVAGPVLVLTHTRTALVATLIALLLACATLFLRHARVRRVFATGVGIGLVVATFYAPQLTTWAMRGQSSEEAAQLTGRTKVWTAALEHPRSRLQELVGSGMSDQSFNGLAIDSNWVATYLDQGWFGLVVQLSILLLLLVRAAVDGRRPQRAIALFLVVYVIVSSFTETGLGSASSYLLDLSVAAALLATPAPRSVR
jgi:hypothetical protein